MARSSFPWLVAGGILGIVAVAWATRPKKECVMAPRMDVRIIAFAPPHLWPRIACPEGVAPWSVVDPDGNPTGETICFQKRSIFDPDQTPFQTTCPQGQAPGSTFSQQFGCRPTGEVDEQGREIVLCVD